MTGPEDQAYERFSEGLYRMKKKGRIYVCHTFYHLYISFLKEFALPAEEKGNATVVLSKMSNDFGDIAGRISESGYFKEVYEYDEKRETEFPELAGLKKDRGNIILNMIPRIIFTSKFAKLQAKYVPVDFREYDDVYVFCDNDPIGIYLAKNKIYYHAVEDGLNELASYVNALYDNRGFFWFKKFLSMKLNLIFIRDGYNKYCLDMEVNDLSLIREPFYKFKEVSRKKLAENVSEDQKKVLVRVFVKDIDKILDGIKELGRDSNILILTEPLCELDVRERIFRDLIDEYSKEGKVFLKIHPRDDLDYDTLFKDVVRFDKKVPMEVMNYFSDLHFKKVVSVFTELDNIEFADEKVRLGGDFMDKYEAHEIHSQEEQIR